MDKSATSDFSDSFENNYASVFNSKEWSLDLFSFSQRALRKHETRNFEVLRANDGTLYLQGSRDRIDTDYLQLLADEYELLYDETIKNGGRFLYVQVPYKNAGQAPELAGYTVDKTEESENYIVHLMEEKGIPVLDLRDFSDCVEYYKTDHHWTTSAAFKASAIIADELEKKYGINLTGHKYYGNINNYDSITYEDSFLGSIGIKVGPYFTGKDDFTVYKPKFDTDLDFKHYIDKLDFEYYGNFWDTFFDQGILEDSSYNNKYNANMHGAYVESIINNNAAENDYRGLLITHSYGRPMAQYMSLDFKELRYLDPQKGRYNDNLTEYISDYQPDIVILMYNSDINVGCEPKLRGGYSK